MSERYTSAYVCHICFLKMEEIGFGDSEKWYMVSENGRDGIWGSEKWYMDSEGRKGILVLEGFGGARVYFILFFRLHIFVYIL